MLFVEERIETGTRTGLMFVNWISIGRGLELEIYGILMERISLFTEFLNFPLVWLVGLSSA